jgi:hypothetical protein
MKYLKMLGLAAIAALALTAFGAGSASAATHLCSTNTSPCTGTIYGAGTKLTATLKTGTSAVLTSSPFTIICSSSAISGELTTATNAAGNVTGSITSITFTRCTDQNGGSCTFEAANLPWHIEVTTETPKSNGNGRVHMRSGGEGSPATTFICGSFLSCTVGTQLATLGITGGSPAALKATELNQELISGFLCPSSAKWDAEYEVTAPKPLYVI